MTAEPQQQPQAPDAAPQHPEAEQLLTFVRQYAVPLAAGVAVAVAAYMGVSVYRGHRQALRAEAQNALQAARTIEELRAVAQDYSQTPAAPPALLEMGSQYVHNGEFPMARQAYARFLERYPDHMLVPSAMLGEACALEGQQQFEQALERYRQFRERYGDHYLAPAAVLGEGRTLQQMGRLEEARTVYEDFIAARPDSRWRDAAETSLLYVKKAIRARRG